MNEHVLITGGAGFIGSHLVDELLAAGRRVRVLDALLPQVHGNADGPPDYLNTDDAEFVRGDVGDADTLHRALDGVDAVVHLAARVGVGQSMYRVADYATTNEVGTAVLLEALMRRPVRKLVVASSMSIYGEGRYRDATGAAHDRVRRSTRQLAEHRWEPSSPDGAALEPVPTPERKPADLTSNYALSKYAQERMAMIVGPAHQMPTTALRFFNVYGPRQALSNPYTGVMAIFASRLLNDKPPLIFEDGRQRRDFVHVTDIARACRLTLEHDEADGEVFNIGSGRSVTVAELAERLAVLLNRPGVAPRITGEYRVGDIRHCFADVTKARTLLGFTPDVTLDQGMAELADWLAGQHAEDHTERAYAELTQRGLAS